MEKFLDLQLFAKEEQVEIPAELEGVSEEVAREVMKEIPQDEPEKESVEETTEETQEEETSEEAPEETSEAPEAEHAETDSDKKSGKVPYERFKEVNDKYRRTEEEAQALRQQLAQLQERKEAGKQEETPLKQQNIPMDLLNQAYDLAKKQVIEQLNLTEEDYSDLEYQDEQEKAKVDRAIKFQFDTICQQAREQAKVLAAQEREKQVAVQTAYKDYLSMAEEEQKRSDFENIWNYATTEHFAALPDYQKFIIQNAFDCVNQGVGSIEQVQLVKDYYQNAKASFLNRPKAEKEQKKVKQMANAPRVDKVRGTPSTGGMTMAEVERMVNETPWEEIPPEIRSQLLSGRLR